MTSQSPKLTIREAKPSELVISGARILDPAAGIDQVGDLVVRAGKVASIHEPSGAETADLERVEAAGLHVFPGFVDPHVHLRTPGREDEEDLETGTRAAAAGGFTKILAMPNTDPIIDSASLLTSLRERARSEARVEVGFLASISRGLRGETLTEMAELADVGAVGFSDDGVPVAEANLVRRAMQYQRLCGGVLAFHEEDPSLSSDGVMHEGPISAALGLSGIPAVSESVAIARDAALAGYEDARVHMLHLSGQLSVQAVAAAKEAGVAITAEVTPHHLLLTEVAVKDLGTNFKMNPPLRSESDRKALIAALKSGVIDCIASDHAPHSREEKEEPFELAPMGVTGLETSFACLYTELVQPGVLDLETLLLRFGDGASVYDLVRPSLAPGSVANLSLADLAQEWIVGSRRFESKSDNSCFLGRRLNGVVQLTVAGGCEAYRRREFALRSARDSTRAEKVAN